MKRKFNHSRLAGPEYFKADRGPSNGESNPVGQRIYFILYNNLSRLANWGRLIWLTAVIGDVAITYWGHF